MKLNLKENFDLTSNAQKYQIVLDTIALMEGEDNFTKTGITTIAMIALAENACEEDVIDTYNNSKMSSMEFSQKVVEPVITDLLHNNTAYLEDIVQDVYNYKERDIEISGKFFFAIKKILLELSHMDTKAMANIIMSATELKNSVLKEQEVENEKVKTEQVAEVNDKLQNLVNSFIKENNSKAAE